jgi:Protein kinase domain/AAA ATPase domain
MPRREPPLVSEAPQGVSVPDSIDGRYRVKRVLGRGGMAVVFEVTDTARARDVALKRLLPQSQSTKHERNQELFEREFHTLSQLAHPCIVQVYDFGLADGLPYYTMELLDGRDLHRLAPLPWRDACKVALDVCSALSLVHSRRFVHRDISPRNVRWSREGGAKLLDFGVVAPMGPTKHLVGTPACCAPESVNLQSLDGRTDLFSLGATLFYALVGNHAFPAMRFADLRAIWQDPIAHLSDLVPDIPEALEMLVLDLLQFDRDARPTRAAEVMERLIAIDGSLADEERQAASAYLATPPLVGRSEELALIQDRVARAPSAESRSVLLEAEAGMGRTRLLDAAVLGATLEGHLVVRCDADDARSGDYGVARAIVHQLIECAPIEARETLAPWTSSLAGLLPEATDALSIGRAQLQEALRAWLCALSARRPFVLAVDDVHEIDEPSASMLALLEASQAQHFVCLLLSARSNAEWTAAAARTLLTQPFRIELSNLTDADSRQLLHSLFGEVPNLELLARRAQSVCSGNPRDLMRFAQHLVDCGTVRYAAGTWSLPAELDARNLPASLQQALQARIDSLGDGARQLANAFALCPDQSFSFDDCGYLSGVSDHARLASMCNELIAKEILRRVDEQYVLGDASWTPLLRASLAQEAERTLHQRLATLFEERDDRRVRAAQHWFRAGQPEHALDVLVEHSAASQEQTARGPEIFANYLRTLPPEWFETFDEAIRLCDALGRPKRHKFILLSRLSGILPMLNAFAPEHVSTLFGMLKRDSGLEDWERLATEADPKRRLTLALEAARTRYECASEAERVSEPGAATRHLARAAVGAAGSVMLSLDLAHLRSWPRLEPFVPLSPGMQVIVDLIQGIDARCAGRVPRAKRLYLSVLERVQAEHRAGLDPSHAGYIAFGVMNGLGMLEAMSGADTCLAWADRIAVSSAYEVNALLIRMMYYVWNGDALSAEQCKRTAERLRVQNSGRPMYEGQHLIGEIQAHAVSGDLTRVRQTRDEIVRFAERHREWQPILGYAKAEYARLVGDPKTGLRCIEEVLAATPAGTHQIWAAAASVECELLIDLEQAERAATKASQYIEVADAELEYVPERLRLARAFARSQLGMPGAQDEVDAVIAHMQTSGFGKLHLGTACETRAKIAIALGDPQAFDEYAVKCREALSAHRNESLVAKSQRLMAQGQRALAKLRR